MTSMKGIEKCLKVEGGFRLGDGGWNIEWRYEIINEKASEQANGGSQLSLSSIDWINSIKVLSDC